MQELNDENHIFSYKNEASIRKSLASSNSLKEFEELHEKAKLIINENQHDNVESNRLPINENFDSFGNNNLETGTFRNKLNFAQDQLFNDSKQGILNFY